MNPFVQSVYACSLKIGTKLPPGCQLWADCSCRYSPDQLIPRLLLFSLGGIVAAIIGYRFYALYSHRIRIIAAVLLGFSIIFFLLRQQLWFSSLSLLEPILGSGALIFPFRAYSVITYLALVLVALYFFVGIVQWFMAVNKTEMRRRAKRKIDLSIRHFVLTCSVIGILSGIV